MARGALTVLLVAACGGSSRAPVADAALVPDAFVAPVADARPLVDAQPIPDAPVPVDANPLVLECRELRTRYAAIVERISTQCNVPGDCRVLGKNRNTTCQPFPTLASRCDGDAVNAAAAAGVTAELDALAAEFETRCVVAGLCPASDLGCYDRCSPSVDVGCVHNTCSPFTPVCVAQ